MIDHLKFWAAVLAAGVAGAAAILAVMFGLAWAWLAIPFVLKPLVMFGAAVALVALICWRCGR